MLSNNVKLDNLLDDIQIILYRVAQKDCNTNDFKKNEGQNGKGVCIIAYKILFQARWLQDR